MSIQIDKKKKEIFDKFGFIDDQSQSMDDFIIELETQRNNTKASMIDDNKIISKKQKLKYITQRKTDKSLEFFCSTQNLFVKLYDTIIKAKESCAKDSTVSRKFNFSKLDSIKTKFHSKLTDLKQRLEMLNNKEDLLISNINRYKISDNIFEVFKNDKVFEVESGKK